MEMMACKLSSNLRRLFEAYCEYRGLKPSTVGLNATRDPRLYEKVKSESGAFTVQTYDKVVAWFAADWPYQLEWPKGVARPAVEPREPIRRKRRLIGAGAKTAPAITALMAECLRIADLDLVSVIEVESLLTRCITI